MKDNNILWTVKSRYAVVYCYELNGNCYVEKIIAPNVVTEANAEWVNDVSEYFRSKLTELQVPLATPYTFSEENGDAIQLSPYIGCDLEIIFKSGKTSVYLLEKIIAAIKPILLQKEPEVGIDARLSNFCLGNNGSVCYVDTFPPLVMYKPKQGKEELIVHFPNPTDPKVVQQEYFRKFNPLGILRRLRFSLLEQNVGLDEDSLLTAIKNVMGDEFANVTADFFANLPDHFSIQQGIEKVSLDDPDGIREVALNCQPPKGERQDFLRIIFDLSSNFCPYNITDEVRIDLIRDILKGAKVDMEAIERKPHAFEA